MPSMRVFRIARSWLLSTWMQTHPPTELSAREHRNAGPSPPKEKEQRKQTLRLVPIRYQSRPIGGV